jgi:hypothetical protein
LGSVVSAKVLTEVSSPEPLSCPVFNYIIFLQS